MILPYYYDASIGDTRRYLDTEYDNTVCRQSA